MTGQECPSGEGARKRLGLLLFNGFEVLDAYGPLEMFTKLQDQWEIVSVAEAAGPLQSNIGVASVAQFGLDDCPPLDALLVPGGRGTRKAIENPGLLTWIMRKSAAATYVLSVCTGSALLAAAGVLEGKQATSNKRAWDWVVSQGPSVKWVKHARWVKDGKLWTGAGVSAGMDMALAFISHVHGADVAAEAASFAEYSGTYKDPDHDPFG